MSPADLARLVALAEAGGATVVRTPAAAIVVIPLDVPSDPGALVPIADAARIAATSARVVRDAIRAGDLAAIGGQRDRAVRRHDLDRWIESRRVRPIAGVDDRDIERRMARIASARR